MDRMEDLPMKPRPTPRTRAARSSTSKAMPTAKRRKSTTSKTSRAQTVKSTARPKKSLPPHRLPGEQPRDSLGRFASKVWQGTKVAAKGTAKAVKGTVKTAKKVHRTAKRMGADMQRRDRIALKERELAVKERAKKLKGPRRKAGRAKSGQGFLSRLIFGKKGRQK